MPASTQLSLCFPPNEEFLIDAIDESAEEEGLSRSAFFRQLYRNTYPEKVLEFAKK